MDQILWLWRSNIITLARNPEAALSTKQNTKDRAFSYVKEHIKVNIINANSSEYVSDLLDRYKVKFQSSSNDTNALVAYNVQNFPRKIRESFDESDLTIAAESTKKTIAYKTGITLEDAYKFAKAKNKEDKSCVRYTSEIKY